MTAIDITIHASFLPHHDPEASLAFYRDTLGFGPALGALNSAVIAVSLARAGHPKEA